MSEILGGALGRLFGNLLGDPPEIIKPLEPRVRSGVRGESAYDTVDEGDTADSESESESDNETEADEPKIVFRKIEDPAPKRLVETRRISDQVLCVDHLAIRNLVP
jgi:hypothetical protein